MTELEELSTETVPVTRTPASNLLWDLLRTAGVCVLALCAAEAALHLAGVRLDASLFQMDAVRGYSFRPGARGWHTAENDVFVEIGQQGNRDRPRSLEPAPGTLRIAVLGSSTTAALEVEQQQTYTARLERELSRPGAPVEVLNFAVEGYGPAQDFYTLENQVWRFHPRIVMDEVSLKQYVLNSTREYSTTALAYPYFRLQGTAVVPDDNGQEHRPTAAQISRSNRVRNFVNSLDLVLLATELQKQVLPRLSSVLSRRSFDRQAAPDPRSDPWRWTLVPPANPEMERGWEVLGGLTLAMRDQAQEHGAEFWVIVSDDAFQVNPDPQVGEKLRQQMGSSTLDYGDKRYDTFLSSRQVNHIDLAPELRAYVHQTGAYLHGGPKSLPGEGHWNQLGHAVVSKVIAQRLEGDSAAFRQWATAHSAPPQERVQALAPGDRGKS